MLQQIHPETEQARCDPEAIKKMMNSNQEKLHVIVREAFNKKKHFFYGIFHNDQTPPGYGKKHFYDA